MHRKGFVLVRKGLVFRGGKEAPDTYVVYAQRISTRLE